MVTETLPLLVQWGAASIWPLVGQDEQQTVNVSQQTEAIFRHQDDVLLLWCTADLGQIHPGFVMLVMLIQILLYALLMSGVLEPMKCAQKGQNPPLLAELQQARLIECRKVFQSKNKFASVCV